MKNYNISTIKEKKLQNSSESEINCFAQIKKNFTQQEINL